MNAYEFTLKFALPDPHESAEAYLDALYESGCDDALVGTGKPGRVALTFCKEASSAKSAVLSAIAQVRGAIPGATLIEAAPDLVGATDIANIIGVSRQAIQKLASANPSFPDPFHSSTSSLWHLSVVLDWFVKHQQRPCESTLLEIATINMELNAAKELRRARPAIQQELQKAIA